MGLLVEGKWMDRWYDTSASGGRFKRAESSFRGAVTADGSSGFPAEARRYHLYVAWACPWAHRTLLYRALKGLEAAIPVSVVEPLMLERGWTFGPGHEDRLFGSAALHELYVRAVPDFTGRVTVPVLWDTVGGTIVNNESSEIIRQLDRAFDAVGDATLRFAPDELIPAIDELNHTIYHRVNNGVYRAGFATTQEAYDEAVAELFETLDGLEARLGERRFLLGERLTEADLRLFPTLVRFDLVYHGHFKCNRRKIAEHPNLSGWLRELYQIPGVAGTLRFPEIAQHYYGSHRMINPHGIVPVGPELSLDAPHDRHRFGGPSALETARV